MRFPSRFGRQWVEAHVVRQADDGLAVEWTEFSPETVRQVLLGISSDDAVRVTADLF